MKSLAKRIPSVCMALCRFLLEFQLCMKSYDSVSQKQPFGTAYGLSESVLGSKLH